MLHIYCVQEKQFMLGDFILLLYTRIILVPLNHQINLVVYFVNSSCISSQFEYIFEGHFLDLFWASPTPTACPTRRLVSMATKRMMEAKHGIIIKNLPDQAGLALLSCHIYHK